MKITMLGTSGSGKTVYMSAMSELFYNGEINGYTIGNRNNNYDSNAFINKGFDEINTLYQNGRFPYGTSSSIIMQLELNYRGQHIIDIDWIDYRGGAIKELANGVDNPQNAEILAALIASDVVMVFIDAAVLKVCNNNMIARSRVGANEISQLLSLVTKKKHINVIFLLSKADSSIINIKSDLSGLKSRVAKIYSRFLADTNTNISQYPIIPVGALGYGNVKTTYQRLDDGSGGQVLVFKNTITNYDNMYTINIASSFATALLCCLESESNKLNTDALRLAQELENLRKNFGPVKNLLDILFNKSKKREYIFDIEQAILANRAEVMKLKPHKVQLEQIASCSR